MNSIIYTEPRTTVASISSDPLITHIQTLLFPFAHEKPALCLGLSANLAMIIRYLYNHTVEPSKVSISMSSCIEGKSNVLAFPPRAQKMSSGIGDLSALGSKENSGSTIYTAAVVVHESLKKIMVVAKGEGKTVESAVTGLEERACFIAYWMMEKHGTSYCHGMRRGRSGLIILGVESQGYEWEKIGYGGG